MGKRRHRENSAAYTVGWVFGIILFLILIAALFSGNWKGNGNKSGGDGDGDGDGNGNGNGNGAGVIFFFFVILIIIFLVGSSNVYYVNDDNDDDNYKKSKENYKKSEIIVYGADWCGYTKKLQKELIHNKDVINKFKDINCDIKYVECSQNATACEPLQITGFPTMQIKSGGKETKIAGYKPADEIFAMVKNM